LKERKKERKKEIAIPLVRSSPFSSSPTFTFSYEIERTLYDKAVVDQKSLDVERGWGYEGAVLVLLDESMAVLDLVKVKTWWYVLLRAIREKLRSLKTTTLVRRTCQAINDRLLELQQDLAIPQEFVEKFTSIAMHYVHWVCEERERRQPIFHLSLFFN
jgi:hypothetical protein